MCWNGHRGSVWSLASTCRHCGSFRPLPPSPPIFGFPPPIGFSDGLDHLLSNTSAPTPPIIDSPFLPIPPETFGPNSSSLLSLSLLDQLFSLRIPTIHSVPNRCRFQIANSLIHVIQDVLQSPHDEGPWIRLLLFPLCILHRIPKSSSTSSRSQLQISNILTALTYWNSGDGGIVTLATLVFEKFQNPSLPLIFEESFPSTTPTSPSFSAISRCKKKASNGQYCVALKMLSSGGLAPFSNATFASLLTLHPYKPPPFPFIHNSTFHFSTASFFYFFSTCTSFLP